MGVLGKLGLDEKRVNKSMMSFMKNKKWADENHDFLKKKYANSYIAVENKKIIASDEDLHSLHEKLKDMKKDIAYILIELVYSEDIKLLL